MRIRILSDLHREFGPIELPRLEADLIILAGDIATKQNALPWIREFCGDTPTVYICGNHEFYGDKLPRVTERLREETKGTNIHVLENESISLNGWHIYGCTLWTDMALIDQWQVGCGVAGAAMNDYKRIRNSALGYKRLTPSHTRKLHLLSVTSMRRFFESHDPARSIIVTHHAPSILSLPEYRRNQPISCAYASHLDEFILEHQPPLWIHGHIHHSNDYLIGNTRVVANPQAYPDEPNKGFNPELIIDLGP
ncbi:MAG TPA: metallophosphoesterase [Haloferula sp.]